MKKHVPGEGDAYCQLMIVGEAPGAAEEEQGHPFVGPSGDLLWEMAGHAGFSRGEVWVTNVVKYRVPDALNPKESMSQRCNRVGINYEEEVVNLWKEINQIKPNCILALGGTALNALTGKNGIQNYRGSVVESITGYPKIVPTLHPAHLLHQKGGEVAHYSAKVYIQFDITRAYQQSKFREFQRPERNIWICKDAHDLELYIKRNRHRDSFAVDIESFKCLPICIGLSAHPSEGVSVPLMDLKTYKHPLGLSVHQAAYIWRVLADFLEDSSIKKSGQNFKYDQSTNERLGFYTNGFYFDTSLAAHTINPELPKSLAFLTSIYTDEPFYKDEGREFDPKKDEISRLLNYNAKDAIVTKEIESIQLEELEELGLKDFFFDFVMPLHFLYKDIEKVGIRVDHQARKDLTKKYEIEETRTKLHLDNLIGYPVNVNSNPQVCKLLYGDLKLPARKGADADTIVALLNNVVKKPEVKQILTLILKQRKIIKLIGTYLKAKPDYDGRMRTAYRIVGTETGRTSTSILKKPVRPEKMGIAFHTMSKHGEVGTELRRIFIPDPDFVFMEVDLSQAEARVVAVLSDDDETLRMFDTVDIHKVTACWIFECEEAQIDKIQRTIGKTTRHAGNYDMGKHELMTRAATMGQKLGLDINMSEWRAGKCLELFHKKSPKIRGVFHAQIQEALANSRVLVNPSIPGIPASRKRTFLGRWDRDLWKEGYAQIPQSTVSDLLKRGMLFTKKAIPDLPILLEAHDAFLTQVRVQDADEIAKVIKENLEVPIDFNRCTLSRNRTLIIPAEIQIGENWRDLKKFSKENLDELAPKISRDDEGVRIA